MKILFVITLICSNSLWAARCQVYGISDSPQKLRCKIAGRDYVLSCNAGKYFLNQGPVLNAFHLEVEEGATPLIFATKTRNLTLTKVGFKFKADLEVEKQIFSGICQ